MYSPADDQLRRSRSLHLVWLAALIFAGLGVRLFTLQVIQTARYEQLSETNRAKLIRVRAPRGAIVDRENRPTAGNRPSFALFLDRRDAAKKEGLMATLADMSGRPEDALQAALDRSRASKLESVCLMRDLPFGVVSRVEEQGFLVPGTSIEVEPVRFYPWGSTSAHLLGYLGEVSEDELDQGSGRDYKRGDRRGRVGIELAAEEMLRGRDGGRYVEVDALGQELRPLDERSPKLPREGNRVVLAADMALSARAQEELAKRGSGTVVAIDPRNGDLLVLVSEPSFDPNQFSGGIAPDAWRALSDDEERPLLNRALTGLYPPGSVFKIAMVAMAMEEGISAREIATFDPCMGSYRFGRRIFRCWKGGGHGRLTLEEALANSCDVFFYQLGMRLGLERMASYAHAWGFGERTGIDLPGEARGTFPDSLWMDRRYGRGQWTRGVELNLAIGQGEVLVTPLGLACFVAGIANGGNIPVPRSWLQVETPKGDVIRRNPSEFRRMELSPKTVQVVHHAMEMVVTEGTARSVALPGIHIAGKTGTAQNPHGEDHAWFVAYAPAEAPEIVVLALVENGGHGSEAAVPVVRSVLASYFGIPLKPPHPPAATATVPPPEPTAGPPPPPHTDGEA